MPLVPMKQTVTITPAVLEPDGTPQTDDWGRPVYGTPYTLKCRVQEGAKLVRSTSGAGGVHGVASQEVVSVARIMFDKLVNISMSDMITFTDENGIVKTYTPISVEIVRGLNGKAILTVVNV